MSEFKHSIKVPTQYRKTTAVLKAALENPKRSLKTLLYEAKNVRIDRMHAVLKQYVDNRGAIEEAIEKTKILEENPRLNPVLCKVLVTELIFGRKALTGESKPVQTVREYKDRFIEALGGEPNTKKKGANKPRYVRINTNLLSLEKAHAALAKEKLKKKDYPPFEKYGDFLKAVKALEIDEYMVDMHVDNLLIFHPKLKHHLACHDYTLAKQFMLQDKGTCLVAELLRPPVGSIVLDMCAAPGMKTIHTCNVLQNKGTIYAIEQNAERYRTLCEMTESAGCTIVKPIQADALQITSEQCPGVEYILVDPSCTGSGIQNRLSVEPDDNSRLRIQKLAGLQIKMLSHAMSAFPDVKRIAYSTCSLNEEENESVVQRCLSIHKNFKLLNGKKILRNKWNSVGNSNFKNLGKHCIYTRPEDDLADGIFIAIFEKRANTVV